MAELQPIEAALEALLADVAPLSTEQVALDGAAGRVREEEHQERHKRQQQHDHPDETL